MYLSEARSRLYRNRFLQLKANFKAIVEICRFYALLHRSKYNNVVRFRTILLASVQKLQFLFVVKFVASSAELVKRLRDFATFCRKC